MKIKVLFCVVTIAVLVGGCTTPPGSGPRMMATKQCPPQACDATIKVDQAGNISIDADILKMEHGDRNPLITWILDAPNIYEFRDGSITPHTGAPIKDKETTSQSTWDGQIRKVTSNKKRFIVTNKNDSKVILYYDVKVYRNGTDDNPLVIDPAMANDP